MGVRYLPRQPNNPDSIAALCPDLVVLASVSHRSWPSFLFPEFHDEHLFPDVRALVSLIIARSEKQFGRGVIYDKNHTDMTSAAAEFRDERFDEVLLVTHRERIGSDVSLVNRQGIYQRLHKRKIRLVTSNEPCAESDFEQRCVTIRNICNGQKLVLDKLAALSFATRRLLKMGLLEPLRTQGINVNRVGDCYAPRAVLATTRIGHTPGNSL